MQVVLERVRRDQVREAQLVPAPGQRQDHIEPADRLVQGSHTRKCRTGRDHGSLSGRVSTTLRSRPVIM